jgi:class 3 adenylate cyclase
MAVMARDSWTDQRLDDLNQRVSDVDRRMEAGFAELRADLRAHSRMMVQLFAGMFATFVVGFLGVIAALIIQG